MLVGCLFLGILVVAFGSETKNVNLMGAQQEKKKGRRDAGSKKKFSRKIVRIPRAAVRTEEDGDNDGRRFGEAEVGGCCGGVK